MSAPLMRRAAAAAIVALLGLLALPFASGATAIAASGSGGVLSVSPAHPDMGVAMGNAYFVHTGERAARWTDQVAVVNTGATVIDAWVDPVDGVTSVRTGAVYTDRSSAPSGAGAWVRPDVTSVSLHPHTQTVVSFTVTVPADAAAGDHLAGISFESKRRTDAGVASGITTVLRSVIAVQVRVPGTAEFRFHEYAATIHAGPTTGTAGISLDMADVGGLMGKPQLEISLAGPAAYRRAMSIGLDTMLPGDRITDEILWPDALAPGDYVLAITEDGSGRRGSAFVASVRLTSALPPSAPGGSSAAAPPAPTSLPPWALVGALAAGVAVLIPLVLFLTWFRRSRCLHCDRSQRRGRLIRVGRMDEIAGCTACAVAVQNAGSGVLCRRCLSSHFRPRVQPHQLLPAAPR